MKRNASRKGPNLRGPFFLTIGCLLAMLFLPVAIVLLIGMAPTVVAAFIDKTPEKLKAVTVGFLNFAGCFPYVLTLVLHYGNTPDMAFEIVTRPLNIVIMYMAAALGYMTEFGVVRFSARFLVKSAEKKIREIEKEHARLVERWGEEVNGDVPLDAYGFPVKRTPTSQENEITGG